MRSTFPGAPEHPKGKGGRHNEKGTLPEPKILKIAGFRKLIRFVKQFISEFRILTNKKREKRKENGKKSKYKRTNRPIYLYVSYKTTRVVCILIKSHQIC